MTRPRVLVTRAPHQASALADLLRARGVEPVLIPTLEIVSPSSFCALDAALTVLPTYHWLVFTSANAVEAFLTRLRQTLSHSQVPASCRVAAIGSATTHALESFGIKPDLVPSQAVAESLAASLVPYARQTDGTPTRFLLPRAEEARPILQEELTQAGAHVDAVTVYRNAVPAASLPAIRSLFADPAQHPQAIPFTSSSSVTHLLHLLASAQLTLPPAIPRISIGPITSATLREHHLPPHAEAAEPTVPALVEKVMESLAWPHRSDLE